MKIGLVLLVITTSLCIFTGIGWRKASASDDLENRIVATHEKLIITKEKNRIEEQELRDAKIADCEAFWLAMPYYLIDICGEPLSITE